MAAIESMTANSTNCYMMDAGEVAAALGCKIGMAYKLIRQWNAELEAMGKLTIRGKINRQYFKRKLEV